AGGSRVYRQRRRKAGPGFYQRYQRTRGEVDALEYALPEKADFADEPMLRVGIEDAVISQYLTRIAGRFEHDGGNVELVEPDMQNRVIEFACEPERPERGPLRHHRLNRGRRRRRRTANKDRRDPRGPVEFDG